MRKQKLPLFIIGTCGYKLAVGLYLTLIKENPSKKTEGHTGLSYDSQLLCTADI